MNGSKVVLTPTSTADSGDLVHPGQCPAPGALPPLFAKIISRASETGTGVTKRRQGAKARETSAVRDFCR